MSKTEVALVAPFLLLALSTRADDDWSSTDSVMEASVQVALAMDALTTLQVLTEAGMVETNPILGRHPSELAVVGYGLAWMAGHYLIARLLPQPWRRIWQGLVFGVEVAAVTNNLVVGGGLRAQW
jgi:hypothetical protein